jgi:hypothetical protein
MRGKIFFLSILALAAIQLSSCQRRSFDPALAGTFFPLQPGMTWTYRIIEDEHGRSATRTLTERVLGHTRAQISEVESEYSGPTGAFNSSMFYFAEHGYFTRQSIVDKRLGIVLAERAFLPQLLKPNLTWSNSLVPFAEEADMLQITQSHRTFFDTKTIEVPAGSFSGCMRIETDALYQSRLKDNPPLKLEYIDWYAPRIGLVKTLVEQNRFFGSEVARIELLRFGYAEPNNAQSLPISGASVPASTSYNPYVTR